MVYMPNIPTSTNSRLTTTAIALTAILGTAVALGSGTPLLDGSEDADSGASGRLRPPVTPLPTTRGTAGPVTTSPPSAAPAPTSSRTPTPARTTGAASASRAPSPSRAAGLSASWSLDSSWAAAYVAQITIRATAARSGWTLSWADPGATSVSLEWGMTCRVASERVTCSGAGWGKDLAAGESVKVGARVQHRGTAPTDPTLRLS
jgi:hypothetical protein